MRTRVQEPLLKPELNNELGAMERRKTHTPPRQESHFPFQTPFDRAPPSNYTLQTYALNYKHAVDCNCNRAEC
jgi:hypothetical protein